MWNGAAEALNASPAMIIASPTSRSGSSTRLLLCVDCAIAEKPSSPVEPYTSAEPKSSTAEPIPPMIRYLSPASSELSTSISIAHRM